jgi:hypothetical protein
LLHHKDWNYNEYESTTLNFLSLQEALMASPPPIYAAAAVSITELRRNPSAIIEEAGTRLSSYLTRIVPLRI